MNLFFAALIPLLAQAAPGGAQPAAGGGNGGGDGGIPFPVIAIGIIMVLLYVMVIGPERKKTKAYKDQLAGIKKNDRVVTIGGIYGVVANINRDADKITLKVDDNTKIDFTLGAISRVISAENQDKDKDKDSSGK